jgi:hypothetical protein
VEKSFANQSVEVTRGGRANLTLDVRTQETEMKPFLMLSLLATAALAAHAESRAPEAFYTPAQLTEMSTVVLEGTVTQIETNAEYKVAFPAKALVRKIVKGQLDAKEVTFKHKHPGRHIILEKEYNTPAIGQAGTFFLQDQGGTLILIGYIRKTEQSAAPLPSAPAGPSEGAR